MQILTVVIGLIFVLLLLSLLATTMMELLSSLFSLRARNLVKALRNMLASDDRNETLVDEFRANSLYRHLTQQYGSRSAKGFSAPSYMSAETFQSILFDVILKGDDVTNLQQRLDNLPDKDLKNVLNQLLRESGGQLDLFRLEVQNWYNNVMDRAAGWYKRYTQKILLFMGLGIAVVFNADTVALYDRLSNDPDTLASLVAAAESYVETRERAESMPTQQPPVVTTPAPTTPTSPDFGQLGTPINPLDSSAAATPPPAPTTGQPVQEPVPATYLYASEEADLAEADFRQSLEELKGLLNNEIAEIRRPLGLGWEGVNFRAMGPYEIITKLLGFILTALAISLGAPFWFDLLKKLVNIRSAGGTTYENR
ncbi:hypothetical protein [Lewinella sp. W8]|uniref:hypothetical protein n=1 Tax=Lewinella sp. W8 TaxID=2528208 RepID=UPI001068B909|nr:hypothetical protein [Lewinella sp. W8]MTB53846.1 hypothetical protein [Lewinella sp. W8]